MNFSTAVLINIAKQIVGHVKEGAHLINMFAIVIEIKTIAYQHNFVLLPAQ
jgi:hypothetical protein